MKKLCCLLSVLSIAFGLGVIGCSELEELVDPPDAGDTDSEEQDTGGNVTCESDALPVTSAGCLSSDDCNAEGEFTRYCHSYFIAPPDANAECRDGLGPAKMRIMANVRNLETMAIINGANVKIAGALETLQADPIETTPAKANLKSDTQGLIDYDAGETVTNTPLGLLAHVHGLAGYFYTVTGLVEPITGSEYPAGVRNRDLWAMPESFRQKLDEVMTAEGLTAFVPFGEKGGVIGRIRDADTGDVPLHPVELISRKENSEARVYYLSEDHSKLTLGKSTCSGIFIVLNAETKEKFDAFRDGVLVSNHEATMGTAYGATYTTSIQVDQDWTL